MRCVSLFVVPSECVPDFARITQPRGSKNWRRGDQRGHGPNGEQQRSEILGGEERGTGRQAASTGGSSGKRKPNKKLWQNSQHHSYLLDSSRYCFGRGRRCPNDFPPNTYSPRRLLGNKNSMNRMISARPRPCVLGIWVCGCAVVYPRYTERRIDRPWQRHFFRKSAQQKHILFITVPTPTNTIIHRSSTPPGCCYVVLAPLSLLLGLLFVMYFPRQPVVDYCSKELDWAGLINNIETLVTEHVYADFEFLVSVYNPNRVSVKLDKVAAQLLYPPTSTSQIGTVTITNATLEAGSVSDTLATVSLSLERWAALDLAQKYARGKLKVGLHARVDFSIKAYGVKLIRSSLVQEGIEVDTAVPLDMQYCNCRDGPPVHPNATYAYATSWSSLGRVVGGEQNNPFRQVDVVGAGISSKGLMLPARVRGRGTRRDPPVQEEFDPEDGAVDQDETVFA